MKIQSKLILTFIALSLPLLVVTNIVFYASEKKALADQILNHLESVASIQQHRIHDIAKQNEERLRLVASRTQLRLSLDKFLISADEQHRLKMNEILRDAQASIADFKHILVYSPDGVIVASSNPSRINKTHLHGNLFDTGRDSNKVNLFHFDENQNLSLFLVGPLYLKNKFLGVLVIGTNVDNMVAAVSDHTGLGQTGETILAAKDKNGDTVFIMPTRFDQQAALHRVIPRDDTQIPINLAFSGKGELLTDATDYRKIPVLAATRYIDDFDWGIVVKIDKEEALAPLTRMTTILFSILACAVSLIIFLSFYLARGITGPIVRLIGVAHNIAADNFDEQAEVSHKDEIGELAAAFNKMTGKLISARKVLEENIKSLQAANQQLLLEEERYREIFNAPSDAIFMHDADTGIILDVNHGMLHMYGYTYDEALQQDVGSISSGEPPYTQEKAVLKVQNAVLHGPQKFDWLCRKKDGTLFWTEVALKYTEFTGQRYVIAVVRDVNDRKLAEAEKNNLEEQLQQAYKMDAIGTLAGGIAHDFNNLLTIILGYAELIKADASNESGVQQNITQIQSAADRAKNLVRQILAFSRQSDHELIPVKLQSLVKETIKLLRSTIPTTVEIIQDIDSQCGVVNADPTQINQIVMNLCTNAVHAMDEKGVLEIALQEIDLTPSSLIHRPHLSPGPYVCLSIADSGCGMEKETLNRIFDPFFTTKDVDKGTGMGLSMVHGIIEGHGGFITVESQVDEGSTFNVFLPVVDKDEFLEVEETVPIETGNERILFVDDEPGLVDMGKRILQSLSYKVVSESSSTIALELFRSNPDQFDLLLTDQSMPNLSGSELINEILKIRPDMPCILCTGFSSKISRENAKKHGISKYINKPYTKKVLGEAIREVLNGKV